METKLLTMIWCAIGIPSWILGAWINFGNLKGDLLFALAIIFGCARLYYFHITQRDRARMRKLEQREKEIELKRMEFYKGMDDDDVTRNFLSQ